MRARRREAGFTLPELLVVVGVIALIVGGSLLFLRPKDYGPVSRNAERWAGLAMLAQGLKKYTAEHGVLPEGITAKTQIIGTAQGSIDLCRTLVPNYMPTMPLDPLGGADLSPKDCTGDNPAYTTNYSVVQYIDGSVALDARLAELNERISLRVSIPSPVIPQRE